jgi:hypothetical protein
MEKFKIMRKGQKAIDWLRFGKTEGWEVRLGVWRRGQAKRLGSRRMICGVGRMLEI